MDINLRSDVVVKLVDHMGSDLSVVNAARISIDRHSEELNDKDKGLINYLMKSRHGTPFEHNSMCFYIEAPIAVFREFHRHRVGWSYNEMSGRYTELKPDFYVPGPSRPLVQQGKPGHYIFTHGSDDQWADEVQRLKGAYGIAWGAYQQAIQSGVAKEVARFCLPVSIYSKMYATCNARSLMHFLSLRTKDENATFPSFPMYEIENVAIGMETYFSQYFSVTWGSWLKNGRVAP